MEQSCSGAWVWLIIIFVVQACLFTFLHLFNSVLFENFYVLLNCTSKRIYGIMFILFVQEFHVLSKGVETFGQQWHSNEKSAIPDFNELFGSGHVSYS